jgi:EARP and GARP complex-interacting protein 1
VALWSAESVSSVAGQENGAQSGGALDGQVSLYDEHEDSCYTVAWSAADPWVFASASYDGRICINSVPRTSKYRILV